MRKVEVYIEGQRLDLFESESINLNRSVQDIKDISKIYTDFTQTFTVPASKNNQKIFRHFEIPEIDNGFDTRIKKDGSITLNSLDFVTGKIRLENVKLKENRPSSFSITFFGNLVSLKDLLGEDKLSELSFLSQFDHPYTDNLVRLGLQDAIPFTVEGESVKAIRYPLISPQRRFIYDSVAVTQETEEVVNIANPGFKWNELKPSIGLEWIIKAIEEKYGLNFSGDFFTRPEFKTLQLWLSSDKGYMKASGKSRIDFPNNTFIEAYKFEGTLEGPNTTSTFPDSYQVYLTVTPTTNAEYDVIIEDNGVQFIRQTGLTGTQVIEFQVNQLQLDTIREFSFQFYLQSENPLIYDASLRIIKEEWANNGSFNNTTIDETSSVINQNINTTVKILNQMPDMTVLDFMQGIFKMFNLTIIPKKDSLEVNNLQYWYSQGRILDVSAHIDNTDLPIEKGTVLKEINLKFKEGKTFLIKEFIESYNRSYGDLNYIIRDNQGNRLDGETLDIDVPFEQVIYERLTDSGTGNLTNIQYGWIAGEDQSPVKLAPHVFYIVNKSATFKMVNSSDLQENLTKVNNPSHIGAFELAAYSTTFSADYEEFSGNAITSNLLTNYYLDYLTDIFSSKRRVFNFKAKFPTHIIRDIKLNDRLIIKGRRYIINTMYPDLTSNIANLELINDIYRGETIESLTTKILLSSYFAEFDREANSGSFTYQTNEEVNYVTSVEVIDTGSGTGWVSFTHTGNSIDYSLTENTSGGDRYTAIKITGFSESVSYHKIKQDA